ncbi:MAG: dephospho-CoA kinase [Lachnospiraceae bacterium]|nr:dephospho-CoA kinase [Lachnospiraceae bacterium]
MSGSSRKNKTVIGLTGGVGAGKSTVTGLLKKEYGALILEADAICKKLMEPGGPAYGAIVGLLGQEVLLPSGEIDKKRMAQMIFEDPAKRAAVNRILHPATFEAAARRIRNTRKTLIVYESALPYEARFSELCDKVLYVHASAAVRRERLKAARGYSDEKVSAIMRTQLSEEDFYRMADGAVSNDGDRESCRASLRDLMTAWGWEAKS